MGAGEGMGWVQSKVTLFFGVKGNEAVSTGSAVKQGGRNKLLDEPFQARVIQSVLFFFGIGREVKESSWSGRPPNGGGMRRKIVSIFPE